MRNIQPQQAGAASGVFNTTRQLGLVIGSAIIGAILQNRLAAAIQERALIDSSPLPTEMRQWFVDAIIASAKAGLEVGAGQAGLASLPDGVPPQIAEQLRAVAHGLFANAFTTAMRASLLVCTAMLLVAAFSSVAIEVGPATGKPEGDAETGPSALEQRLRLR